MTKRRPTDANQLAKLIVDMATGEVPKEGPAEEPKKNEAAAALGRKGGAARAANMSSAKRSKAAKNAARARWGKR